MTLFDVEVRGLDTGWSNDMVTGRRERAVRRARELASTNRIIIRVISDTGELVDYLQEF